jgi:hypothetical protein
MMVAFMVSVYGSVFMGWIFSFLITFQILMGSCFWWTRTTTQSTNENGWEWYSCVDSSFFGVFYGCRTAQQRYLSLDSPMRTVFTAAAQPSNENGIYRCRAARQRFPWPTRLVHSAVPRLYALGALFNIRGPFHSEIFLK